MHRGFTNGFYRDLLQFPVAHASDGYVDVVAQKLVCHFFCLFVCHVNNPVPKTNRGQMLGLMDGAEQGKFFWSDSVRTLSFSFDNNSIMNVSSK